MEYCLKITKKDGSTSKHYYSSYDELDYNATFCQYSSNIICAIGLELGLFKDKLLFKIGELSQNKMG